VDTFVTEAGDVRVPRTGMQVEVWEDLGGGSVSRITTVYSTLGHVRTCAAQGSQ
jgi:hypothetical protein